MVNEGEQAIEALQHYHPRPSGVRKDETFLQYIYNKDKSTVLGRTAKSWGK